MFPEIDAGWIDFPRKGLTVRRPPRRSSFKTTRSSEPAVAEQEAGLSPTRSKVRVDVRTLLGTVSELRLHRLACYGVAAERMVAEWSKPERLLDGDHGAFVAVGSNHHSC